MPAPTPSRLPEAADPGVLYLLDLSGYVFRAYHALPPLSSSSGEPTHAVHGVVAMLLKLMDAHLPQHLAVALDTPGPSARYEIYADYKANRPPAPPDLQQQMQRVHEVIEAMGIRCFGDPRAEADDIIATLTRRAVEAGMRVVIVSADKDLLQLVSEQVLLYDTMGNKVFGPAETEAKMGVPPAQVGDLLALTGDRIDNVPGVPSVGPKTATTLLQRFGSLEGIYDHLEEIERPALKKVLSEHRDQAFLSQRLVRLDEHLSVDVEMDALGCAHPDSERLLELFRVLDFHRFVERFRPKDEAKSEEAKALEFAATAEEPIEDAAAMEAFVARARECKGFALAIETREEQLCLALACDAERAWVWHPQRVGEAATKAMQALLDDWTSQVWCADAKLDIQALRAAGLTLQRPAFDVALAAYLLEAGRRAPGFADIAKERLSLSEEALHSPAARAAAIVALRQAMHGELEEAGLLKLYEEVELPLSTVLAEMEWTGIRVDLEHLSRLRQSAGEELARLEKECFAAAGHAFNLASPRQLEGVLFDDLKLPVLKKTKTARSTDHEVLEDLAPLHPLPALVLEHRSISKLVGTYLDALPRQVKAETGRIHTRFNQNVAATGRLSSSDPNLQNIPIRTPLGRSIRDAFVAAEGWRLFSADYSQIELRVLAHLSADPELCEAFQTEDDVHIRTACALFGVSREEVSRDMRGRAKTVNFAVIYGQSEFALARNLRVSRKEAKHYIEAFFARYRGVHRYLEGLVESARESGEVRTLLGRRRLLPDLRSKNHTLRSAAERIAKNTPVQGTAADIMKVAMVRIGEGMRQQDMESRMLLTVHDELVFEVPPAEEAALEALARKEMQEALRLDVPLKVEVGWGRTWGEAH